jgi:hypothetical protein
MGAHAAVAMRSSTALPRTVSGHAGHQFWLWSCGRNHLDRPNNHSPYRLFSSASSPTDSPPPPAASDWPKCANPTPYDILNHPPGAPYSKTQFRQLVKLYHPDLHSTASTSLGITPRTRLERYHLIVQAHDILSDPAKRQAYDACGAHWGQDKTPLTDAQRYEAWRNGPYAGCANNATWEDWERWYEEQANGDTKRSEGYYMSNRAFLGLVISTISIVAIMQAVRAETRHLAVVEQTRKQQKELCESLMRSQAEVSGLGQEQRIERFLRHRENMAYGFQSTRLNHHSPVQNSYSNKR